VRKKGQEPTLRLLLAWRVEDTADDDAAATWDVADGAAEDISYSLVEKCNSSAPPIRLPKTAFSGSISVISARLVAVVHFS